MIKMIYDYYLYFVLYGLGEVIWGLASLAIVGREHVGFNYILYNLNCTYPGFLSLKMLTTMMRVYVIFD